MLARTGRSVCMLGAVAALVSSCGSAPKRVASVPQAPVIAPAPEPQAAAPIDPAPVPVESRAEAPPPPRPVDLHPAATTTFAERPAEAAAIDTFLAPTTADLPPPSAETAKAVVDDLGSRDFDIDIPLNDKVLGFVELFSGRLKGYLEEGLGRGAPYLPMVQSIFEAEGLPLDLSYVPLIESAFKPSAVSRAKARGMWQFMRGTALENGLRHDWYLDERADPEKATRAAAKYLKFLYEKFGDWHLALASYNGGYGRVQRAMKRSGRDDFWELSSTRRYLPRETRDYVPLILAAVIVARNPAQYGLAVQPVAETPSEVVTVASPTDLRRVAEWIGASLETLQDLNPELRRWTTPVRDGQYPLRVPLGAAETVQARAAELAAELPDPFTRHTVKKGETLASVANKLRVTRADLAEANYLSVRARLSAGQQLIIPRPPALLEGPDAVLAASTDEDPADVVKPASAAPARARASVPDRRVHRVRSGETLFSIARLYRTTVASIREWNNLRGTTIRVGQRLTIRGAGVQAD
jgi:membrane-bound lytic murein transglycosylase D